jgi:thioredoxin-dependent peroxiredoxin
MVWIPGLGRYKPRPGNRPGDTAPDFALLDHDDRQVRLSAELGDKPVVLVFFPRASTPGCTKQMCSLRDGWQDLQGRVKVFGISYDRVPALHRFHEVQRLPFPLLSDAERNVAKLYGVNGALAAARVTFVIGTDGRIREVIDKVRTGRHAEEVLSACDGDGQPAA